MRAAVFLLAGLQLGLLILFAVSTGASDPAGTAMSQGFVTLGGIVMAVFLAPALILAINRKAPGLALFLAIIPLLLVILGLANL